MLKKDVLTFYGNQTRVAEVLGITRQAVSLWPEIVPNAPARELQYLTGGQLKVAENGTYGDLRRRKKTAS